MSAGTGKRNYTIAICKGALLLPETKALLAAWEPGEDLRSFQQRVQSQGLLGRSTSYRTHDIVHRVFARRFLRPDAAPARALRYLAERGCPPRAFADLVLLCASRKDDLLYDFVAQRYWPAHAEGRLTLSIDDALSFFDDGYHKGYLPEPWSGAVQVKIARGLLGALQEAGMIRKGRGTRREIVTYRASDVLVAYLLFDLHFQGLTDSSVYEHQDWSLFGLSRDRLIARADELSEWQLFVVQHAGSVVRVTWNYDSMEEAVREIADRLV